MNPSRSPSVRRTSAVLLLLAAAVVAQAPANDGCSTATPVFDGVNPIAPEGFSGNRFTNVGATNSGGYGVDCVAATHFNKDVWFTYVSSLTGFVSVGTCTPAGFSAGTLIDTTLAVYAIGSCPGGATALACNDDACTNLSSVTFAAQQGQSYLIRVGSWSTTASGTFYLTVAPQMPNDACGAASTLDVGTSAGSPVYTLGTTYAMTNTPNLLACGPVPSADVWYAYTASSDVVLHVNATGTGVKSLVLYKGGCPAAGQAPDACDFVAPIETQVFLAAGETARVRVRAGATFEQGVFALSAWADVSSAGDFCANAIDVVDGFNPAGGGAFDLTQTTEYGEPATGACPSGDHLKSKWFRYVSSITGDVEVTTCTLQQFVPASLDVARVYVYANDCQTLFSGCPIACAGQRSKAVFFATYGQTYYVRVATTTSATYPDGPFQIAILPTNGSCGAAQAAGPGTVYGTTYEDDAFLPSPHEAFYTVTVPSTCTVDLVFASGGANKQVAAAADCAALANATLGVNAQYAATGGVPFRVKVRTAYAGPETFALAITCNVVPTNDEPAGAAPLADGVNPFAPNGVPWATYSNAGATTSQGLGACAYMQDDVFYSYATSETRRVRISLCPVAGLPTGTLDDPVLEVLAFGNGQPVSSVGCNDDFCGLLPGVEFLAKPGFVYYVRVGQFNGGAGGTFRILVDPQLTLSLPSPLGPGSISVVLSEGEANAPYLTILTLNAGDYPNGPFFGIAPSTIELAMQVQAGGAPFLGLLDASGAANFGPVLGLPPLTVFGVTIAFDSMGFVDEVSAPTVGWTF